MLVPLVGCSKADDVTVLGYPYAVMALVLGVCLIAGLLTWERGWSPSLRTALLVAAAVRVLAVSLSNGRTPHDVAVSFHHAGQAILHGVDPLRALPPTQWNFLPFSGYLFAAEIKTGLGWDLAVKLLPVACDLLTVWLIGLLASDDTRGQTRFLYAVSPVAILVSGWHGQIEPIAICLSLAALVLATQSRPELAGVALGFAVAAKTWPILFLPGVLKDTDRDRRGRTVSAAAAVLAGWVGVETLALHTGFGHIIRSVVSYRSFTGVWGWSGILRWIGVAGWGYSGGGVSGAQAAGTVLTVLAVTAAIVLFWSTTGVELTVAVLLAFLVSTAGFGTQYLLWPMALLCLSRQRVHMLLTVLAAVYAGVFYLYAFPLIENLNGWPAALLQVCSVAIVVAAAASVPWRSQIRQGVPHLVRR